MGEAEHQPGDDPGIRQGHGDTREGQKARHAQGRGRLRELLVHRPEGGGERLNSERQAVDQRRNYEPFKGERQAMAESPQPETSQRAARTHGNQQIETQHCGRQHERQRHYRFDQKLPTPARIGDPVSDGHADHKQHHRHYESEFHRKRQRLPVHGVSGGGWNPYSRRIACASGVRT